MQPADYACGKQQTSSDCGKRRDLVPRAGGRKAREECNDQHEQVRMGDREGAETV